MEVHMSQRTAEWLGAFPPDSPQHHRLLRDGYYGPYLLVRDEHGMPLFWPLQDLTVSSCD